MSERNSTRMSAEKAAKFLPAFFLPIVEMGEQFAPGKLPLHVTLHPPIEQPYESSFGAELRGELNQHEPFLVEAGDGALFGPEADVPVRLVAPSLALQGMHALINQAIGNLRHDATYRAPYRPHISVERLGDVPRNQTITIGGLAIVEKWRHENWVVVDKIGLKGEQL